MRVQGTSSGGLARCFTAAVRHSRGSDRAAQHQRANEVRHTRDATGRPAGSIRPRRRVARHGIRAGIAPQHRCRRDQWVLPVQVGISPRGVPWTSIPSISASSHRPSGSVTPVRLGRASDRNDDGSSIAARPVDNRRRNTAGGQLFPRGSRLVDRPDPTTVGPGDARVTAGEVVRAPQISYRHQVVVQRRVHQTDRGHPVHLRDRLGQSVLRGEEGEPVDHDPLSDRDPADTDPWDLSAGVAVAKRHFGNEVDRCTLDAGQHERAQARSHGRRTEGQ